MFEAINRALLANPQSQIMDLKLISLNVNGLNDHLKQAVLVDWLKCMKVDVVCLQETLCQKVVLQQQLSRRLLFFYIHTYFILSC